MDGIFLIEYRGTDETTSWLAIAGSINLSLATRQAVEPRKNEFRMKNEFSSYLSILRLGKVDCTVQGQPALETPQTQQRAARSLYPYCKVSDRESGCVVSKLLASEGSRCSDWIPHLQHLKMIYNSQWWELIGWENMPLPGASWTWRSSYWKHYRNKRNC